MPETTDLPEPAEHPARQRRKQFARNLAALMDADARFPAARGRARYLAERLHVSHTSAGLWLAGDRLPDVDNLMDLMTLLNCGFEDLLHSPEAAPTLRAAPHVALEYHGTTALSGWTFYAQAATLQDLGLPALPRFMRVDSAEMMPFAGVGDAVIYDAQAQGIQASGVYVLRACERNMVRRVTVGLLGEIRLTCDNPAFVDEITLDRATLTPTAGDCADAITVLGPVVARILVHR